MKQAAILTVLAIFAIAGTASIGGLDDIQQETPSAETTSEASPHQIPANVNVEKNGETVVEDHNVMLDGQRVLTHLLSTTDDSAYNVVSVGRDNESYDSTDNWHEPSNTESSLEGRYDEDVENGMSPQTAELELPDEEQSLTYQTTFRATNSVEVATTALEVEHDRYNDTSVDYPRTDLDGEGTDGSTVDYNFEDEWSESDYEGMDTFAATDFGRVIPLEEDDELTVTWEIIPQNPDEVEQE